MALFLARLMNLMDPVVDGKDTYGFIPLDVDDNDGDFDIESPYGDLTTGLVETLESVTHLYELGVGSGTSTRAYGPSGFMSRKAMAEFMAAILDHSNLRPQGVLAQVTPREGLDDFEITVMISVRDSSFTPLENQPVDWFYTDDPEGNGGLQNNGTCDDDLILGRGDCVWEESDKDTDEDGNTFVGFRATPGRNYDRLRLDWTQGRR